VGKLILRSLAPTRADVRHQLTDMQAVARATLLKDFGTGPGDRKVNSHPDSVQMI
jgi:hypothetical protein